MIGGQKVLLQHQVIGRINWSQWQTVAGSINPSVIIQGGCMNGLFLPFLVNTMKIVVFLILLFSSHILSRVLSCIFSHVQFAVIFLCLASYFFLHLACNSLVFSLSFTISRVQSSWIMPEKHRNCKSYIDSNQFFRQHLLKCEHVQILTLY